MKWRDKPDAVRPMLATLAEPPLAGPGLVYEPKYDGIRALVHVSPRRGSDEVRIWSRLGNDKTSQFPSIVRALREIRPTLKGPLLLDGEIVALDEQGRPAGFQRLQGRIHLTDAHDVETIDKAQPAALIAFDLLRDGDEDLRGLSLTARRARLEQRLARAQSSTLRISEQVAGDGHALQARALAEGWEGLIVKEARAPYQSGRRSPSWRKLKVVHEQEFVIGGWTEPRQTRQYFGALLLGVREKGADELKYVGHTGTGFNQAELARVWKLLKSREVTQSPFSSRIKTNEPAHWVRPDLVAQVKFTEWTTDDKLRHPVYLGLRDDKLAADVVREEPRVVQNLRSPSAAKTSRGPADEPKILVMTPKRASSSGPVRVEGATAKSLASVVAHLKDLENARRDGTVNLPDGTAVGVTNLAKVFWPAAKLTKGALLRYYAEVSPLLLPAVADRPLVMKRFPNGIDGPAFYQQRSRQEKPPAGVRVETLPEGLDSEPDARRFVGGSLITLLYMSQIAAISQDPWFSRVQSPLDADYVALDLDPDDGIRRSRACSTSRDGFETSWRRCACTPCRKHPGRAGCTSTCRSIQRRRTNRGCCSARSSRPSSRRVTRAPQRSNALFALVRAVPSTSIFSRTSWARRSQPPTVRAPAPSRAYPLLSAGKSSTTISTRGTSRSPPLPHGFARSGICGRRCGRRSRRISRRCSGSTKPGRVLPRRAMRTQHASARPGAAGASSRGVSGRRRVTAESGVACGLAGGARR